MERIQKEQGVNMQIKKLLSYFIFTFIFVSTISFAQDDPVKLLREIADQMIAGLKANKATLKSKPQIVFNLAYRFVVPHADLNIMSKHVLPPHIWNSATPSERQVFQQEFTRTLIRTYASALISYQDQTIQFYPVRAGGGSTVVVNSKITGSTNEPIHVSYRLIKNDGWKLYDMSVEGVSMLESFRSQFADILSQGDIRQLLNRMKAHNR